MSIQNQEEVDRILDVANRWPKPELDAFFYTRLIAKMESQQATFWQKMEGALTSLTFKWAFATLLLANGIGLYFYLPPQELTATVRAEVMEHKIEYYSYNNVNYSY